jgi:ABC-type uncharacterized transport system permease subunit
MNGVALRLTVALLPVLYFGLASSARAGKSGLRAVLLWAAALLHGALFLLVHRECGAFPLMLPGAALSALALAMFVFYAWVEWRSGVTSLGGFVLAAVFVVQLAASAIGFAPAGTPASANTLFIVHVITIIASVATLLLSGFFGAIYLVVEREMRSQRFGAAFTRLPNLSELAAMNRRAATLGFVLMTAGLNLGIWLAHDSAREGFSYRDPMVLVTMATWIVFGIIALSRWVRFLSGRKAAVTAICGLVLLILTFVVSLVPGLSFHHFA